MCLFPSWHEIGTQDLPAMIDYVLETTNQRSLSYVGHSQGTTSFFVMTSEKPEYNQKIKSMHALAPVAYIGHCWNPYVLAGMPLIIAIEVIILMFISSKIGLLFFTLCSSIFIPVSIFRTWTRNTVPEKCFQQTTI